MIYLGTLGRMVGLKCPASQQVAVDERVTFESTLGGRKVGQIAPGNPKRVWQNQLSDASTPAQVGAVMAFINGEWGNGPFIYVSADAPGSNLLTPAVASCGPGERAALNVTASGPMLTPDGWAGRSYMPPTGANLFFGAQEAGAIVPGQRVPVIPGDMVTGSAYVLGAGAHCRVLFYDAADTFISQFNSTVLATAGAVVRSWVAALAPANAVAVRVLAVSSTQATRPAVTWSAGLLEWGAGQGCMKAVPHGASSDLIMASRDPRGGRYSNLGFTITEVG